jgi:hypothetical protein
VEKMPLGYSPYPETDILLSEFFIAFLYKKLRKRLPFRIWPGLRQDAMGRIRGVYQSVPRKGGIF